MTPDQVEALAVLAADLAASVNNMLAVIVGNAEMLLDRAGNDPEMCARLETMLKAADGSAAKVNLFLDLLRSQGPRI